MATVLITEADSAIGSALAVGLAAHRHQVIAGSRSAQLPRGVDAGMEVLPIELDLEDPASIRDAITHTMETYFDIDVVIANGITGVFSPLELLGPQDLSRMMSINLTGQLQVLKEVIPHFRRAGRGRILGISSTVGMIGLPGGAVPCAARAGFEVALEALRHELRPFGVIVSLVQAAPADQADYGLPWLEEDVCEGAYRRLIRSVNDLPCEAVDSEAIVRSALKVMSVPEPDFRLTLGDYQDLVSEVRRASDHESAVLVSDFFEIEGPSR